MDIYLARQPIFYKDLSLFGYELLHRKNADNQYLNDDHSGATAELLGNSFLVLDFDNLTDGTRGFINFTQDLLETEIPHLLPKGKIVVEILESVTPTELLVDACKKLKSEGYTIALDDFILNRADCDYTPLIELADIIKIEFPIARKEDQRRLLKEYRSKVKFLAERIETREEFLEAAEMGYELFQGYFFSRPVMVKSREITPSRSRLREILRELQETEPDLTRISQIIAADLGLTYKLLRMMNSVHEGVTITNLRHAVDNLGILEMKRWVSIMLAKDFEKNQNNELVKVCMQRGKLLLLLARELKQEDLEADYYFTGILSSLDMIMNQDMEDIIRELAVSPDVKEALMGKEGDLKKCLDLVIHYERAEFEEARFRLKEMGITMERFDQLYRMTLSQSALESF